MTTPYLGEIRLFAGNFAPSQNAMCAGQLMSIQQNTALFSLLGTFYGGNGTTNFALPDLQGRLPICFGQGNGLTNYQIGTKTGTENVTLLITQIPSHTHTPIASTTAAAAPSPASAIPAALQSPFTGFYVQDGKKTGNPIAMAATAIEPVGGNQPHENRMPALAISIIIALSGVFPSRN